MSRKTMKKIKVVIGLKEKGNRRKTAIIFIVSYSYIYTVKMQIIK